MKKIFLLTSLWCILLSACTTRKDETSWSIPGLQDQVEILRDSFGVNHIYARNEHDLFFAQGYSAAKDRLFQFEIWRLQATGTVAQLLGERELNRDIGARLFRFRGNLKNELNHYHPHGEAIINAFTEGINTYIREARNDTSLLPLEFKLLGFLPQEWTPDVVISRHQGLLGNLLEEVSLGRAVSVLGQKKVKAIATFESGDPSLVIDPSIGSESLLDSISVIYNSFRAPLRFKPEDLIAESSNELQYNFLAAEEKSDYDEIISHERDNVGSNNWIVNGAHSESGFPLLANDPHRAISVPSLRYMVHLNAPGWNVVGGGEPTLPGVSIGHNEKGAWGLTIFAIDGEDMYVYDINPQKQNQYRYKGQWEEMQIIKDTIHIKGASDVYVEHKYTRHGPVTMINLKQNKAFAVRCAWLEPGGAPYLASLRMDQATTWDEFREACTFSHLPGENMIWADRDGTIGWQVVGIAPIRKNWSGLVPVPGDGRFEWDGYLPIKDLPHVVNPEKGFWATANEDLIPLNYEHRDAVGWQFADSFRADRVNEVLASRDKHTQAQMMSLQSDYLAIPARTLVPLVASLYSSDPKAEEARKRLLNWNFILDKNSIEAGIYVAWEKKISSEVRISAIPENSRKYFYGVKMSKVIGWLTHSDGIFAGNQKLRDEFLIHSLELAVKDLESKLGPDITKWQYGQANYHHARIRHLLSAAVNDSIRKILETEPLPRGGYAYTPGATGNSNNQSSGASFRMVVDTKDWDKTVFTNTPGQSGDPHSPFYKNLFERWANDRHFPVYFSREKVEAVAVEKKSIAPAKK